MTMTLRPSQTKFESPTTDFEVASAFARPMAAQLNRPLVSLLSHLGVKTEVLLKLQARTIQSVKDSRSTLAGTAVMLRRSTLGGAFTVSSLFFSIDRVLGLQLSSRRGRGLFVSPFLSDCLDIAYHDTLCAFGRAIDSDKRSRQIKYKTRLPVAGSWTLVGVADECVRLRMVALINQTRRVGARRDLRSGRRCRRHGQSGASAASNDVMSCARSLQRDGR